MVTPPREPRSSMPRRVHMPSFAEKKARDAGFEEGIKSGYAEGYEKGSSDYALGWKKTFRSLPAAAVAEQTAAGPFIELLHDTHQCVLCGGFVGCIVCGTVVCSQQKAALSWPCRGVCPSGSQAHVRKLSRGVLPRGKRWPSGETEPTPKRIRREH